MSGDMPPETVRGEVLWPVVAELFKGQNDHMARLDTKLDEVLERLVRVEETADATLAQATKTNGRVSKLEEWRGYIEGRIQARQNRRDGAAEERERWTRAARLGAGVLLRKDTITWLLLIGGGIGIWVRGS